jgi:hypothetical protein
MQQHLNKNLRPMLFRCTAGVIQFELVQQNPIRRLLYCHEALRVLFYQEGL